MLNIFLAFVRLQKIAIVDQQIESLLKKSNRAPKYLKKTHESNHKSNQSCQVKK